MDLKDLTNLAKKKAVEIGKKTTKEDVEGIYKNCKSSLDRGDKKGAAVKLAEGVGKIASKK